MFNKCSFSLFIFLLFECNLVNSQDTLKFWEPAAEYQPQRGKIVGIGLGSAYVASMTGLYYLWYSDYSLGSFHGFNDSNEWLQVDKAGHLGSAYYLGKWGIDLMQWTGMPRKKATWLGGSLGFIFLTTVEIFDGFSNQWGFSSSDMAVNTAGTAMAISQELLWNEQRINIKFSWHDTRYNDYNPELLGADFQEKIFKDYNGQTYWLSGNVKSFLGKSSQFPAWLNIAAGYGAQGMTGARDNSKTDSEGFPVFQRYRQFYLSPDVDLTRIKTKNKTLKTVFNVFGFLKIPAPALEYNEQNKFKFHWLYF